MLPIPKPTGFQDDDTYKLSLSFGREKYLTPWVTLLSPKAKSLPIIEVELSWSGTELKGARARVDELPEECEWATRLTLQPLLRFLLYFVGSRRVAFSSLHSVQGFPCSVRYHILNVVGWMTVYRFLDGRHPENDSAAPDVVRLQSSLPLIYAFASHIGRVF